MLVISNWPRARPILQLLAQLQPELYSTRSNYYYLLLSLSLSLSLLLSLLLSLFLLLFSLKCQSSPNLNLTYITCIFN